ncbi:hypothetical protein HMPREF3147_00115 [Corynebacterium sp. HMSC05D03]|nr:hypothetical protein HMPREF2781_08055 [Corynebacterium sp. HMSC062A03]OFT67952.1 hypothetical protein HMPREF3147_00115 [Corynebacterium sp. HMSC05D03]
MTASGPRTLRAHEEASAVVLAIVGEREGVELRCEGACLGDYSRAMPFAATGERGSSATSCAGEREGKEGPVVRRSARGRGAVRRVWAG